MTRPATYKRHVVKNKPGAGRPVLSKNGVVRVMIRVPSELYYEMERIRKKARPEVLKSTFFRSVLIRGIASFK